MNTPHAAVKPTEAQSKSLSGGMQNEQYLTVSKSAVVCVVFAFMSLMAYMFPFFVLLPFLGVCFGIHAIRSINKYPQELTGKLATKVGVAVCSIVFVTALASTLTFTRRKFPTATSEFRFTNWSPTNAPNCRTLNLPLS